MKKLKLLSGLLLSAIFLTSCGTKTVTPNSSKAIETNSTSDISSSEDVSSEAQSSSSNSSEASSSIEVSSTVSSSESSSSTSASSSSAESSSASSSSVASSSISASSTASASSVVSSSVASSSSSSSSTEIPDEDPTLETLEVTVSKEQKVIVGDTYIPDQYVSAVVSYSNNRLKNVSATATYTCDTSVAGTATCTVEYGGLTDTFDVTVYQPVALSTVDYNVYYNSNEAKNLSGDISSDIIFADESGVALDNTNGIYTVTSSSTGSQLPYFYGSQIRLYGNSNNNQIQFDFESGYVATKVTFTVIANKNDVSSYLINGESYSVTTSESINVELDYSSSPISTLLIQNTMTINARLYISDIVITLGTETTEMLDITNHTYVKDEAVDPTCETDGYVTYICEETAETLTVIIPKTGHMLDSTGYCAYCGKQFLINVPDDYFTSSDVVIYDTDDENPYGIDLTKYGSDTHAIFYDSYVSYLTIDPYENVDSASFYSDYSIATTYEDAYYRSAHYLLSGHIDSYYLPTSNTKYSDSTAIRCQTGTYILDYDGNYVGYFVNSSNPYIVFYGGAYISLEDVAAYLLAFGEVPVNSNYSTSTTDRSKALSEWGQYGRVNIADFSGDNTTYPYEPVLTDISGCGGSTQYTESDYGSSGGFDVGGSTVSAYTDGKYIARGTCRFVFVNMKNDNLYDINKRHVFYTYNHYNDFNEYLNYENGWSNRFGNETAGNAYCSGSSAWNSSTMVSPTPVPEYVLQSSSLMFS
ncbi:MAG: hypothetical protein K6A63_02420 [Acholeplasmatales bacterium]|nr:hypothetical protein [Acholeplasmatales bacterium]